jgi:hypothetical protein
MAAPPDAVESPNSLLERQGRSTIGGILLATLPAGALTYHRPMQAMTDSILCRPSPIFSFSAHVTMLFMLRDARIEVCKHM